jgi:hypothetical protein
VTDFPKQPDRIADQAPGKQFARTRDYEQTHDREDGRSNWEKDPQGSWLVIRYDDQDVGARPVPNGDVYWESPDIEVVGGDGSGNPTGGIPVGLRVHITNYGSLDAAPVRVDFAFIAPSLGILPGAPQVIGTAWTTVLAGHTKVVDCPTEWTPPTYETNLHACLLVTCSAPAQGDTPTVPANPALDRHVGQRNLTIIEAAQGATMIVQVIVANALARPEQVHIAAAAAWHSERDLPNQPLRVGELGVAAALRAAKTARTKEETRLWLERATLVETDARVRGTAQLTKDVQQVVHVRSIYPREGREMPAAAARPAVLAPHAAFTRIGEGVFLEPGDQSTAEVSISIPTDAKRPWLAVRLAQTQGGAVTGGYTVLIRVRDAERESNHHRNWEEQRSMTNRGTEDLDRLVIEQFPAARTTREIAYQLTEILPIESLDRFVETGRISVGGREIPTKAFKHMLTEEMFPIRDSEDLVRKVAAGVRVATDQIHARAPKHLNDEQLRLVEDLVAERTPSSARPGFGVFRGNGLLDPVKEGSEES